MTVQPFKTQGNAGTQLSNLLVTEQTITVSSPDSALSLKPSGYNPVIITKDNIPPISTTSGYYLGIGGEEYNRLIPNYRLIGFGWIGGDEEHLSGYAPDEHPPAFIGFEEIIDEGCTRGDLIFGTRNTIETASPPKIRLRVESSGDIRIYGNSTSFVTVIGPIPNFGESSSSGDREFESIIGNSDGTMYVTGSTYIQNIQPYPFGTISKIDYDGSMIWQKAIEYSPGTSPPSYGYNKPISFADGIITIGGVPVVAFNDYTGNNSNVRLISLDPITGSVVNSDNYFSNSDIFVTDLDYMSGIGLVLVGGKENVVNIISNVSSLSSSGISNFGVPLSLFDANNLPTSDGSWEVSGGNIISVSGVVGINFFTNLETSPLELLHGGSLDFGFLYTSGDAIINGSGDFTIESWIYVDSDLSFQPNGTSPYIADIISGGEPGTLECYIRSYDENDTTAKIIGMRVIDNVELLETSNILIDQNTWNHVVFQRANDIGSLYLNGSLAVTGDFTASILTPAKTWIGTGNNDVSGMASNFPGLMTNIRVSNAFVYNGNFSLSTAPLDNTANTQLLLTVTINSPIGDSSSNGHLINSAAQFDPRSPYQGTGTTVGVTYSPTGGTLEDYGLYSSGIGYTIGDNLIVYGNQIGGSTPDNDMIVTITDTGSSGEVIGVNIVGSPPDGLITGNIYLTINQVIDFSVTEQEYNIRHIRNQDAIIATLNWKHAIGGDYYDQFFTVSVDSANNVYACGNYDGTGGSSNQQTMICKFNVGGEIQWIKCIDDDTQSGTIYSSEIDSQDNLITVALNDNDLPVVTKLDPNGIIVWQIRIMSGAPMEGGGLSLVLDDQDNILFGGNFGSLFSQGNDMLIIKLNTNGNVIWQRSLGTSEDDNHFYDWAPNNFSISNDQYLICGYTDLYNQGGGRNSFVASFSLDGSGLGIYENWTYKEEGWNIEYTDSVSSIITPNITDLLITMESAEIQTVDINDDIQITPVLTTGGNIANIGSLTFTGTEEFIRTSSNGFVLSTGNYSTDNDFWIDTTRIDPSVGIIINGEKRLYHSGDRSMRWFNLTEGNEALRFFSGNITVYDENDYSQEMAKIYINNYGNVEVPVGSFAIDVLDQYNEVEAAWEFLPDGTVWLPSDSSSLFGGNDLTVGAEGNLAIIASELTLFSNNISVISNNGITLTAALGSDVTIENGNLNINGYSLGYITQIGPTPNWWNDVFIESVAGASGGNVYAVGGDWQSDVGFTAKLDANGNIAWMNTFETPLEAIAQGVAVYNDIPYIVYNDYSFAYSNVMIQSANPIDGSALETSYINGNTSIFATDIQVSNTGNIVIVGNRENSFHEYSNVAPIAGSNVSVLGVNVAVFGSEEPVAFANWKVNGYGIDGDASVIGIDTFLILDPTPNVQVNGGSISFDGDLNSYIRNFASNAAFVPTGTDDFTIETWIKSVSLPGPVSGGYYIGHILRSVAFGGITVYVRSIDDSNNSPDIIGVIKAGTASYVEATGLSTALTDNAWHYVVIQRSSGIVAIYVDGTLIAAGSLSDEFAVGDSTMIGANLHAELTNLRVTLNAVYGSPPSNPSASLPKITGTTLLFNAMTTDTALVDSSDTGATFTITGVVSYDNTSPYRGSGCAFFIAWSPINGAYSGVMYSSGSNYNIGDSFIVLGTTLGGISPDNDCNVLVTNVDSGGVVDISVSGIGPFDQGNVFLLIDQLVDFSVLLEPGQQWNVREYTNNDGFVWTPNWSKFVGASGYDEFRSVAIDSNGVVYAAGYYYNADVDENNAFITKFDINGNVQWIKSFGDDSNWSTLSSIVIDSDNNVLVSGISNSGILVTKINPAGEIIWQRRIGNGDPMEWNDPSIAIDSNNNVILAILIGSIESQGSDILIIKISTIGNIIWQRSLGSPSNDYAIYDWGYRFVTIVDSKHYAIGGYTYNNTYWYSDGFVSKLPLDGTGIGVFGDWTYSEQSWTIEQLSTTSVDVTTVLVSDSDLVAGIAPINNVPHELDYVITPLGSSGGNITAVGNMTFIDGSVQTTAYSGNKTWITPNNTLFKMKDITGAGYINFNGSTPIVWWDAANSPPDSSNYYAQFAGAIIEYHALLPNSGDVFIGQIMIASGNGSNNVTHTETSSSYENGSGLVSFWNRTGDEGQLLFTGRGFSEQVWIQWSAKIFYGYENFC